MWPATQKTCLKCDCMLAAEDLGLIMDKTIKLEWHKLANTRTRCLRITQVGSYAALCSGLYQHSKCCATGIKFYFHFECGF